MRGYIAFWGLIVVLGITSVMLEHTAAARVLGTVIIALSVVGAVGGLILFIGFIVSAEGWKGCLWAPLSLLGLSILVALASPVLSPLLKLVQVAGDAIDRMSFLSWVLIFVALAIVGGIVIAVAWAVFRVRDALASRRTGGP
jgi:hypothetical protein